MPSYPDGLPQLADTVFLTDSGLETTLLFQDGYDLPHFAAFPLLRDDAGRARLDRYFMEHAQVAERTGTGFILESATWRASPDWGDLLGYSPDQLDEANRSAIESLRALRSRLGDRVAPVVVSGCIGPRGDGYDSTMQMTAHEARDYHIKQVQSFAVADADMVNAMTINYADEAIGIVQAATAAGMPVAVSFTVETDGLLPDGTSLPDAIANVDGATSGAASYFSINCAHPSHIENVLDGDADWTRRLRGFRANASRKSHAELDAADTLDRGDPLELADGYARLRDRCRDLTILGGCCGTDVAHLEAIAGVVTA